MPKLGAEPAPLPSLLTRANCAGQAGVVCPIGRVPQRQAHLDPTSQLGQFLGRPGRRFGRAEFSRVARGKVLVMAKLRNRLKDIPHRLHLRKASYQPKTCQVIAAAVRTPRFIARAAPPTLDPFRRSRERERAKPAHTPARSESAARRNQTE